MDNITMPITVNIVSEEKEELGLDSDIMLGPCGPSNVLSYPLENQEQYKAKINFTILQVIAPVSIGGEGGEHILKANASIKAAKEADRASREAKNASRTKLKQSKTAPESTGGGSWFPPMLVAKSKKDLINESNELSRQSEKLSNQSVQHARNGAESLKDAYTAFVDSSKFSDRTVDRRKDDEGNDEPSIQLYLPVAFQQNDSFSIPGTELGLLGAGTLAGMNQGSGLIKSTMDQFSQGLGSIFDMAKDKLDPSHAAVVTARLANKLAPSEVAAAFSLAAGVTVNPNVRSIFKGVNLREYAFQFKFLPKSQKEAEVVEKIINKFRTYSYPEVIEMGPVAAGYKYPDLFRIAVYVEHDDEIIGFDYEGNEYTETVTRRKRVGNRIKDCYLRSVSTNYNASSMAFHPDGRPVEIDLALNFVEEETISRRDVERGY